jgi:pimeloyl-ACP methyl ester carboxylesterase
MMSIVSGRWGPGGARILASVAGPGGPARGTTMDTSLRHRTVHGYRRAYRMAGSGPAVVLLHGIGDSSESWVEVMADLARDHSVVAPDLLGHGGSDKPRADYSVAAYANGMRDLLTVLGIESATVVGHSLGGGIAAQMAYQHPALCDRLVLVASGGAGQEVTPILRLAAAPLAEVFLAPARWPVARPLVRAALSALAMANNDLARDRRHVDRVLGGLPDGDAHLAFTRTLRSVVDWRGQVVTLLDRCYLTEGVPALIVWGDRDGVIPVSHAHRAHAAMPGSRLDVFPGAGHFPHHDDHERFVDALRAFIATTAPATHDPARFRELLRSGPDRVTAADLLDAAETPADDPPAAVDDPAAVVPTAVDGPAAVDGLAAAS